MGKPIPKTEGELTAEDYFQTPDPYARSELVRGVVVPLELPGFQHGLICGRTIYRLACFLEEHRVGRAFGPVGIITHRNPDTVRAVDVAFYDEKRLPGETPIGYVDTPPNVLFEIVSPFDDWAEIHTKIAEYLRAGVELVCVLVPETTAAHLFYPDRPGQIRQGEESLPLPSPLEEFDQTVSAFFARR